MENTGNGFIFFAACNSSQNDSYLDVFWLEVSWWTPTVGLHDADSSHSSLPPGKFFLIFLMKTKQNILPFYPQFCFSIEDDALLVLFM